MILRIEFPVDGIPPKKDGAKSMWSKPNEALKIISLRTEAFKAMQKAGLGNCIHSRIDMEFSLFVPDSQLERIGDLDNFIAGICDGLQKASAGTPFDAIFHDPLYQTIHPSISLLENDAKIMAITAKKLALPAGETTSSYYIVALTTLS
jgi:hypothetical protein